MATSSIARKINELRVLRTLLDKPAMSRAEVARDLGLTKSTLTNVVGELVADKLIAEFDLNNGTGRVGRPGITIGLNPKGAYFLGAEIGVSHVRVTALDLTARRVGLLVNATPQPNVMRSTFGLLEQMVTELCRRDLPVNAEIRGMCAAFPGFVDRDGILLRAPHLGWRDVRVRAELQSLFRWPVFVENDANLSAFGEWYLNKSFRNRQIALVSLTDGVGCGVVSDGRIARGAHGLSGEIGHVVLDQQMHGGFTSIPMTWEKAVDKSALLNAYERRTGLKISLDQLVANLAAREVAAVEVSSAWASWMGYGLLTVIYAYDPDDIIIAGEMAPLFELCADLVRSHLDRILIEGYPRPHLLTSALRADSCVAGAAAFMHNAMFDGSAIAGMSI
jgi:predicted NBD/HSP70 family sugar kinase